MCSSYASSLLANPCTTSSIVSTIWVASTDLEGGFCGGPSSLAAVIISRAGATSDQSQESSLTSLIASVTSVQWFWSAGASAPGTTVPSFVLPQSSLALGTVRLTTSSQASISDLSSISRWSLGSSDVLHSLALPAASLKLDAVPGRSSTLTYGVSAWGISMGQCSELCGLWHCHMPWSSAAHSRVV